MKIFRQLSTRRLLALLGLVGALAGAGVVVGSALSAGADVAPPSAPLAQAIHDALTGTPPAGVTADVEFTNNLLPSSSSFLGNATSALLAGGSGRLWITGDGTGRIELQSDAGDTQILWDSSKLTVYDSSTDTAYEVELPAPSSTPSSGNAAPPSLDEITSVLTKLETHATLSDAEPGVIAGQAEYTVAVSPKENGGLFGDAELAWAASNGVPLELAITAKGDATPVLQLEVTDISFGPVDPADVAITPPADTKIVELGGASNAQGEHERAAVTGIEAVRAAVSFPLQAPASVSGLSLSSARLVGKGALLTYGDGLGALVVHESASQNAGLVGPLGSLPTLSLGSISAHELATPLGTVLAFDAGGVAYVVGGSMTTAEAEAAAQAFA